MIYIYRDRNSTGARDLAEQITTQGVIARRTRGLALRNLHPGDQVVCWGSHFAAAPGTKTLNNVPVINKYREAKVLAEAGIATVEVSLTRPIRGERPNPFVPQPYVLGAGRLTPIEAQATMGNLNAYVAQQRELERAHKAVAAPVETWLPRKNNHIGGNDLLTENLEDPSFYSRKENLVEEYRLHMFGGKSIRAGIKIKRPHRPDGRTPSHAWIRSFDAGWIIQYENFQSTPAMRTLASNALKALGLHFGAVDMARKADGSFIVLEVNRAPGIENNTTAIYARRIIAWSKGEE